MDEHTLASNLLGQLRMRSSDGEFQPSVEELRAPFEGAQSLLHGFCEACGLTTEITHIGIQRFEKDFGFHVPKSPSNLYIHFTRCLFCHVRYENAEIRQIPA